jgi:hypothetical protein
MPQTKWLILWHPAISVLGGNSMTISQELITALLLMDSYNRGYGQGIGTLGEFR